MDDAATVDIVNAYVSTGISVENFYPGLCSAIGTQNPAGRILCEFYLPIQVKLCYPFDLAFLILLFSKLNQGALKCFIHLLSPDAYQGCKCTPLSPLCAQWVCKWGGVIFSIPPPAPGRRK